MKKKSNAKYPLQPLRNPKQREVWDEIFQCPSQIGQLLIRNQMRLTSQGEPQKEFHISTGDLEKAFKAFLLEVLKSNQRKV